MWKDRGVFKLGISISVLSVQYGRSVLAIPSNENEVEKTYFRSISQMLTSPAF
jgi:hypothetical protein